MDKNLRWTNWKLQQVWKPICKLFCYVCFKLLYNRKTEGSSFENTCFWKHFRFKYLMTNDGCFLMKNKIFHRWFRNLYVMGSVFVVVNLLIIFPLIFQMFRSTTDKLQYFNGLFEFMFYCKSLFEKWGDWVVRELYMYMYL